VTCVCTARSPNAKPACSSRCSCRTAASETPRPRRVRATRSASSPASGDNCARRCCARPSGARSAGDVTATVLLDADAVAAQVRRLGVEIASDHPDGVVLVGVLKGALIFVADLVRAIAGIPVEVDFISISRFAPDSGRVKILHDLECDIGGRDVVVVEDIVDTGLALAYLIGRLGERGTRRLSAYTLLDRPTR